MATKESLAEQRYREEDSCEVRFAGMDSDFGGMEKARKAQSQSGTAFSVVGQASRSVYGSELNLNVRKIRGFP